jgi:CheY-like chemotaxis protein
VVVEDDLGLRELLKFVIERAGHSVHGAADGVEAIAVIGAVHPDLVISDHEMPRINGTELHQLLGRGDGPRPPMILLTAYDDSPQVHDLSAKVAGTIYKPFQPPTLLNMIQAALGTGA